MSDKESDQVALAKNTCSKAVEAKEIQLSEYNIGGIFGGFKIKFCD